MKHTKDFAMSLVSATMRTKSNQYFILVTSTVERCRVSFQATVVAISIYIPFLGA